MVYAYGAARGSANLAVQIYQELFPNRRVPDRKTIQRTYDSMRETGKTPNHTSQEMVRGDAARRDEVLDYFQNNPTASTRRASLELETSHMFVWRTLQADNQHPYHLRAVQDLLPGDFRRRMDFCRWFLQMNEADHHFQSKVLWTDEATFTRSGSSNSRNTHVWAHENPYEVRTSHYQHQFSVNVWLGVVGDVLLEPIILPPRLNAEAFHGILQNEVLPQLNQIPVQRRQQIWWQMDGCPSHNGRNISDWLNQEFPERWIGRFGNVAWPARSPDLTPMDFYIWGTLKASVYSAPVQSRDELIQRIRSSCDEIRGKDVEVLRATMSVVRRCRLCIQEEGRHFEQLLQ